MSADLFWRPNTPVVDHLLPRELKYILAPVYLGHDGSLGGEFELNAGSDEFLRGVKAATQSEVVRDAIESLRIAIQQYGSVIVQLRS